MLLNVLLLVVCGMVGLIYTFLHKFVRRPLGIYSLPPELLSEIASHLDFVDVISLRQSTRKLREATEARVVWHSLAKRYSARHFNIPRPENGTIDTLTTHGLRKWIWPRLVIDQIWRKKTVVPTRRILSMPEDSGYLKLLPGGRWLLVIRTTGHMYFYDLDSKEPIPQLLLEPSLPGKEEAGPNLLVVDINRGAPVLDFTFAISATGSIRFKDPSFGWLHISQASLVGTGESATLSARKLVSIPHIRRGVTTCAVALSGDLVARNVFGSRKKWIEVFRWKECTPTEFQVAIICVSATMRSGDIFFIGEDRILCIASRRIFIHRIPPLFHLLADWDREVGYQGHEDVAEPMWSYDEEDFHLHNNPSLYFDGSTGYRLIVQDKRAVIGILIPLSPDSLPCVQLRLPRNFFTTVWTGLYKGCAMDMESPCVRFGYGWDDETDVNFIKEQSGEGPDSADLFFDEETGRCVLTETRMTAWVFDFTVY